MWITTETATNPLFLKDMLLSMTSSPAVPAESCASLYQKIPDGRVTARHRPQKLFFHRGPDARVEKNVDHRVFSKLTYLA